MRIGITGGNGFIGKWVTAVSLERGHDVIILDHKKRGAYADDPRVDYLLGDVRDEVSMFELAAHCDGVIHLAAVLGTQETIDDPRPAAETNVIGGLNFLQSITRYNLPGVYICVGNHWMNNPYSISKTTVERFCHMYRKERGTRINQVRAVNAYGPKQAAAPPFAPGKVRKIMPSFICRALSGMPIEVYGDGSQVSDMVWVGDLAYTLVHCLEEAEAERVHDFVVECGPLASHTVKQVAEKVNDAVHSLGLQPVRIEYLPMRPGEVEGDKVTADTNTMVRADLDPSQMMVLSDGIKATVEWFQSVEGFTWRKP